MVFKRMLAALGVGGPSVDTVLDHPVARPGGFVEGQVHIRGGDREAQIDRVLVSLITRVKSAGDQQLVTFPAAERLRVAAGEDLAVPLRLPVPWETPITTVYGRPLTGMVMGVRTELEVTGGRDRGDLDPVGIEPLPAQQRILDALSELGFRFKSADVEPGVIHGLPQQLPVFQEIEFWPAPQYAGRVNEVELTFVADPRGVEVVLELDKRRGHDAYSRFAIAHDDAGRPDWTRVVDGWIREATDRHVAVYGAPGPEYGYPGHRRGPGIGTAVAAGAAGVVGGMVAGELIEEAFFDEGDEDFFG
ncbi:sporulation protein [Dactylosporangium sp. CA-139066]|uniref:sporulation protein n=1 Tax=Dactylosporangium sp. CA-139066 TaxID=3239930 RepID=UPI003D8E81A5